MGPSLAATSNIGILISTVSDPAGIEETNAAIDSTTDSLTGLNAAADKTAEGVTASNDEMIASYKELGVAADETAVQQAGASSGGDVAAAGGGGLASKLSNPYVIAGAAIVGSVGLMVKSAMDFQTAVTRIYTTAGETAPLQTMNDGLLQIARTTGTSTSQLTQGLYTVSSAGYTAASGLQVLQVSAEAAKAENADLGTVTDALTSIMHNYHQGVSSATGDTNAMITAVSLGKMHLQDFASSLSTVLPMASSVGMSFAQIAGAEATLTAGGVSADQATQDLHAVLSTIIAPTTAQVTAMQQMGLSSVQLSENLGKNGLTSTLNEMFEAITKNVDPSTGLVLQSAFKNATLQTQDFNTELANSPPQLQALGQQLVNGSISFADFRSAVQSLPEGMTNLGKQLEGTYNQMNSFNSQLISGANASPTFTAELKAMTGQTNSMNAILMLTGANQTVFNQNVKAISKSMSEGGQNIAEWPKVLGNMSTQLSIAKEDLATTGITIGTALIPVLTDGLKGFNGLVGGINSVISGAAHALGDITNLSNAHNIAAKAANGEATAEENTGKALLSTAGSKQAATKDYKDLGDATNTAAAQTTTLKEKQAAAQSATEAYTQAQTAVSSALKQFGPTSAIYISDVEAEAEAAGRVTSTQDALTGAVKTTQTAQNTLGEAMKDMNGTYDASQLLTQANKIASDNLSSSKKNEANAHLATANAAKAYTQVLALFGPNSSQAANASKTLTTNQNDEQKAASSVAYWQGQVNQLHKDGPKEAANLSSAIDTLSGKWKGLDSNIQNVYNDEQKTLNMKGSSSTALNGIFTSSGVGHYASGGTNIPGGMAIVGEDGPELVYLPSGSSVFSNTESNQMMGQSSGGMNQTNSTRSVSIGQVILSTAAAVSQFITQLDLDSISVGKGLTASRGI